MVQSGDLVMLEALKDSVMFFKSGVSTSQPPHAQWGWPIYLQEWLVLGVNVPKDTIN